MRFRGRMLGALNMFRTDTGLLRDADVIAAQASADVASLALVQHHITLDTEGLELELTHALSSRVVIEQAKGIVIEATGLGLNDAFSQLRSYAHSHSVRLADISGQIVAGTLIPNLTQAPTPRRCREVRRDRVG